MIEQANRGALVAYTYEESEVGPITETDITSSSEGAVKVLSPLRISPNLAGLVDYLNQAGLFLHTVDKLSQMTYERLIGFGFSLDREAVQLHFHIYKPDVTSSPESMGRGVSMLTLDVDLTADASSFTIGSEMPIPFIRRNMTTLDISALQRRIIAIVQKKIYGDKENCFPGITLVNLYSRPVVPIIIPSIETCRDTRVQLTIQSVLTGLPINKCLRFWIHLFAPSGIKFHSLQKGGDDPGMISGVRSTEKVVALFGVLEPGFLGLWLKIGIKGSDGQELRASFDAKKIRMYGQYQAFDEELDTRWDSPVEFCDFPFFLNRGQRARPKSV